MYFTRLAAAVGSVALYGTVTAQISQQFVSSDVCYRLNIPASTAKTGNGDIFFSITGPTTYSWIGLGQGSNGMNNANTFIIYTDGSGNITLSPRHASRNRMPMHDTNIDAEPLSGSGVHNGTMTANIRCGNCQTWGIGGSMDFAATSGAWIYARLSGNSLNSTNFAEPIRFHSTFVEFTWPFPSAVGGASANPFQDPMLSFTPAAHTTRRSKPVALWCHGIFAATGFAIVFPLGAMVVRVGNSSRMMWIHAGIQIFAWVLFATAFSLDFYFGITHDILGKTHPVIGIITFGVMTVQPLSGWLHHKRYTKTGARGVASYEHVWLQGRATVILGMINGGLGLKGALL